MPTSRTRKKPARTLNAAKRPSAARRSTRGTATIDDESHVDGCDVDFTKSVPTADAELPPATGGVEVARRTSRAARRRTN